MLLSLQVLSVQHKELHVRVTMMEGGCLLRNTYTQLDSGEGDYTNESSVKTLVGGFEY